MTTQTRRKNSRPQSHSNGREDDDVDGSVVRDTAAFLSGCCFCRCSKGPTRCPPSSSSSSIIIIFCHCLSSEKEHCVLLSSYIIILASLLEETRLPRGWHCCRNNKKVGLPQCFSSLWCDARALYLLHGDSFFSIASSFQDCGRGASPLVAQYSVEVRRTPRTQEE